MTRPVRPIALVLLTACMVYPGVALLWQGLHAFVTGAQFNLVGQEGLWNVLAARYGVPVMVPMLLKAGIGLTWVAGVLGLWAGDQRAYPVALAAAALTLLDPGGAMVMSVIALVCLLRFRENPAEVTA